MLVRYISIALVIWYWWMCWSVFGVNWSHLLIVISFCIHEWNESHSNHPLDPFRFANTTNMSTSKRKRNQFSTTTTKQWQKSTCTYVSSFRTYWTYLERVAQEAEHLLSFLFLLAFTPSYSVSLTHSLSTLLCVCISTVYATKHE